MCLESRGEDNQPSPLTRSDHGVHIKSEPTTLTAPSSDAICPLHLSLVVSGTLPIPLTARTRDSFKNFSNSSVRIVLHDRFVHADDAEPTIGGGG